jgi:hypothetical protein
MVAPTLSGYSADVRLEMVASGRHFPLGQMGRDCLIFDEPVVLPGAAGEVTAYIDQHVRRWQVTWEPYSSPRQIVKAEFVTLAYTPSPNPTRV